MHIPPCLQTMNVKITEKATHFGLVFIESFSNRSAHRIPPHQTKNAMNQTPRQRNAKAVIANQLYTIKPA